MDILTIIKGLGVKIKGKQETSSTQNQSQEQTITTSCNTAAETFPIVPKSTSTGKKSSSKKTKNKRKYIKAENLDSEIKRLSKKICYLKHRKKEKKPLNKTIKKESPYDREWHFYSYWFKERDERALEVRFDKLRNNMINAAQEFIAFSTRLDAVAKRFGTTRDVNLVKALVDRYSAVDKEEIK